MSGKRNSKKIAKTSKAPAKRKATDAAQHKRFLEAAKAAEADERPEAFERAFKKVTRTKPSSRSRD